jgi:hypothetical protein
MVVVFFIWRIEENEYTPKQIHVLRRYNNQIKTNPKDMHSQPNLKTPPHQAKTPIPKPPKPIPGSQNAPTNSLLYR